MTFTEPRSHRASAQRRRAALLDAARELVGEVGAGAVTHRAVAKRANVPLSTTSYFFDSIDDLVAEAMRDQGHQQTRVFDEAERAWVFHENQPLEAVLQKLADQITSLPITQEAASIETFLASARDESVRESVAALVTRFEQRAEVQIDRLGTDDSSALAWAILLVAAGANLHRVAGLDDTPKHLADGLALLLAGALLSPDERDAMFRRLDARRAEDG